MSSPKEKAVELVDKYWEYLRANLLYKEDAKEDAKECALIAVEEMKISLFNADLMNMYDYWFEVKKEIKNL